MQILAPPYVNLSWLIAGKINVRFQVRCQVRCMCLAGVSRVVVWAQYRPGAVLPALVVR